MLTFSILFLNVMAPLSEIHRVLDEGHEASLRVGDLLEMLRRSRVDRSFVVKAPERAAADAGEPVIEIENLAVEYLTPDGTAAKRGLDGLQPHDPPRRNHRRGRPFRRRQSPPGSRCCCG